MDKSDSIKELSTALNKAQAEMSGAKKDSDNPFFKSKYADLGAVVEAVKVPFSKNGLSYSQFPVFRDGFVGVETILMHTSGEWLSGEIVLPMKKQDPQAAGSAITYARRYALQSIAGIPSDDDDGNSASGKATSNASNEANDRMIAHNNAVRDNLESIIFVKTALRTGDWDGAAEAMVELGDEVRMAIGLAATKGGVFDLEDTRLFKTEEYVAARTRYFEDKK